MDEARVEVGRPRQVPEGVKPVGMIQVGIEAEDLAEACLDIVQGGFRKPSALADPIAAGECGKRHIEGRRTSSDRGVGGSGVQAPRGIGSRAPSDIVGREGLRVTQFASNPTLN